MNVENVKRIAVFGAGIMGPGIALACAHAGYPVVITSRRSMSLERAVERIARTLDMLVETEVTARNDADLALKRIQTATDARKAAENSDFIIETIPEIIEAKKQLFRELDEFSPKHAIFASNTSALRITELAKATTRGDKVIGTHWMNPPYLLPLVEIVPGAETSRETLEVTQLLLSKLGKTTIVCKDTAGFLVNRIHAVLLIEAISIVEQGIASIQDVDKVWTNHLGLRYPFMGPFKILDTFGLDTELSTYSYLYSKLQESKFRPPDLLRRKVEAQELGLKTGKGFYDYSALDIDALLKQRDRKLIALMRLLKLIPRSQRRS